MRSAFIALLYAAAFHNASARPATRASPVVNVSLRTSWGAPPFLVELLESFSLEFPTSFFPLLDVFSDGKFAQDLETASAKRIRDATIQIALEKGILKDFTDVASLDSTLALHAATPAVQAFYSFYEERHGDKGGVCPGDGKKARGQAWVDWYGRVACTAQDLQELIDEEASGDGNHSRPKLLAFDHIHPSPSRTLVRPGRTAILYTSLDGHAWNLKELHDALYSNNGVEYVVRYIPPRRDTEDIGEGRTTWTKSYLTGYGVALDLKKTDYLVLDDRHSRNPGTQEEKNPTDGGEEHVEVDPLLELIQSLDTKDEKLAKDDEPVDSNTPLSEGEIVELGYQASQLIIAASATTSKDNLTTPLSASSSLSPLSAFTILCQNFPKYAQLLSRRVTTSPVVDAELRQNALRAQAGANVVWVNGGIVVSHGADVAGAGGAFNGVDVLKMKRVLRKEKEWIRGLEALGLSRQEAVGVVSDSGGVAQDGKQSQGSKEILDGRVDASDRPEGGDVVLWWNNIEEDVRYSRWSPSFYALLRPIFPGQFPPVRRNLFNIVLVLDLSTPASLHLLAGTISSIIERGIPFHFGLVPSTASDESRNMANAIYWLINNAGRRRTMEWLRKISGMEDGSFMSMTTVDQLDWNRVRLEFDNLAEKIRGEKEDVPELEGLTYQTVIDKGALPEGLNAYTERLNVRAKRNGLLGHAFFNGKYLEIDQDAHEFLGALQMEIGPLLQYFQELIYQGALSDSDKADMTNWFYDQPGVSNRRNTYISPPIGTGPNKDSSHALRIRSLPGVFEKTGYDWTKMKGGFVYPPGNASTPFSTFIITDLDSEDGLAFVQEALKSLNEASRMRLTFMHNPSGDVKLTEEQTASSGLVAHLVVKGQMSENAVTPERLGKALGLDVVGAEDPILGQSQVVLEDSHHIFPSKKADEQTYKEYVQSSKLLARELGFAPGETGLVINGRIIGPIERGAFIAADFKALEEYEYKKRTAAAIETFENVCPWVTDLGRTEYADLVSFTASILGAIQLPDPSDIGMYDATPKPRGRAYTGLQRNLTMFTHGDYSTAMYHVVFVVNPLSETAQKWSSLIKWLTELPDIYIEVHLNPNKQSEIPLKRFYRYNIQSALTFDENEHEISAQTTFEGLPVEPLYTLAMDVPSSWLVRPREAPYDLDNIQLTNLLPSDASVDAVFELDYLVIEGHARDTATNSPPRGLQLQLVNSHDNPIADTLVVANLGYIQFRAKPGVFKLEIREGRGSEVYRIDSVGNEGWDSPSVEVGGKEITLTSFDGLTLYPRFSRKEGMETASVLEWDNKVDERRPMSKILDDVTSKFKSFFRGSKEADPVPALTDQNAQAEINIFTVASGLLYERFVGIMILSVLRNTNSTVKFWFIENFLSPSFLEFIPHMAEEYGFQYELVTYKWPSWLRAQREKQRTIWAYKILFLDVLFPMDLKKVIFVDADQIVRADLKELVNLDLHGAPYAYTPMGDDNHDMEGFRFWKKGYWADALDGRPYHISALYVIDLVRLRQLAAGDILRGQYQQLSADPNSLANLDQDLPNNLQRMVPIYSLHEDWLWCETWCSKDRLHRAKTIDLCQNPLTKEPKLARARQIPEWEEYDAEIAGFTRKLAEEGKIRSGLATADVNSLANAGNAPAPSASESTPADAHVEPGLARDEL